MPRAPLIALLSDFGTSDGYVGVMKGVMLGIAPDVPLVDLTHDIPPQDIATGAWVLHTAWRYLPAGSIILAVVDPGVGSARRAVALRAGERLFVGPDNGLFTLVLAHSTGTAAYSLEDPRYQLPAPSATFHGRDIFAPAAAHLAAGVPIERLGAPLDVAQLVRLPGFQPEWRGAVLIGCVVHVDHFGNLITNFGPAAASALLDEPAAALRVAGRSITARAGTFAQGPAREPFLLRDSSGELAIAVRNGAAAAVLGARRGAIVEVVGLRPPDAPGV